MRGGKRENAGRKPSGRNYVKVRMTKDEHRIFQAIGGSAWLAKALKEIDMKAQDIISEAMDGDTTTKAALEALEDGAWLESIGCKDDQAAVEEAYNILEKQHQQEIEDGIYDPEFRAYNFVHGPVKVLDDDPTRDPDEEIRCGMAEALTCGKIGTLNKNEELTFYFRIGDHGPERVDAEDMNLEGIPHWQMQIIEEELLDLMWDWWYDYRAELARKAEEKADEDDED